MKRVILIPLISLLSLFQIQAQETLYLTLDDVIQIASQQSLDAFKNENMYLANYWEFRYFKADRLPSLLMDATLVDFNRSMQKVYNYEQNRDEFIERQDINSAVGLRLNQNVGFTGGQIYAQSSLAMTQKLGDESSSSYSSVPFSVGYSQNINGYNRLKWTAKIEPLKFEKAKKRFIQTKEELALKANRLFFNLVDAQIDVGIEETNLANADTLYTIGKGRFQVGTVTQDELLNLELRYMNSDLALTRAKLELERAKAQLNSFLSFEKDTDVECIVPSYSSELQISAEEAIAHALENNPEILDQRQRLLEEDRRVNQAKSETGISGTVFAQFGLNQNSNQISNVYKDPSDRQQFRAGLTVPILDWGRRKGQLAMARSNREVERISINQEKIDFEQNIVLNVMEFNLQGNQVLNTAKADTIAQLQYDVTQQRFLIGKVDVTKLNLARNDREQARRAYIRSLRSFWNYYITIRRLTLYDFEKNISLSEDFDKLINKY